MSRTVSEEEFRHRIRLVLTHQPAFSGFGSVTGPGRSGAVAAVYASHILSIPFLPYLQVPPKNLWPLLIIDTAAETGATLRKARRKYSAVENVSLAVYQEPPRVTFWYEAPKPQRYKHERPWAFLEHKTLQR